MSRYHSHAAHRTPGGPGQQISAYRTADVVRDAEDNIVAEVVDALARAADIAGPGHVLVAAFCDALGQASDLFAIGPQTPPRALLGLRPGERPDLSELLRLAGGGAPPEVEQPEPPGDFSAASIDPSTGVFSHRRLLEEGPLAFALLDRDGVIQYASPAMAREIGQHPGVLLGRQARELLHPDDQRDAANVVGTLRDGARRRASLELRIAQPDGSHKHVEAVLSALHGPYGGDVEGTVVALRDRTHEQQIALDHIAGEQRARALADGADVGLAIVDADRERVGTVLDANRTLALSVGSTVARLVGRPVTDLFTEDDAERLRDAIAAVASTAAPSRLDAIAVYPGGGRRVNDVTITSLPGFETPRVSVCMHDVTDDRALATHLQRTVDRLSHDNRELSEFARISAHDIAAPARAVLSLLDMIPPDSTDAELDETLAAVRAGVERIRATVDAALEYTQTDRAVACPRQVDLGTLVRQVLETLTEEIEVRDARVTVGELPAVSADDRLLERVFLNLISNALKYAGDAPPSVSISARHMRGGWQISVADEGTGIAAEERQRVFDLHARGSRAGGERGHGIGLATCRRAIELHGGRIWVEPRAPRGSVFHFTLPDSPRLEAD